MFAASVGRGSNCTTECTADNRAIAATDLVANCRSRSAANTATNCRIQCGTVCKR